MTEVVTREIERGERIKEGGGQGEEKEPNTNEGERLKQKKKLSGVERRAM